MTAKRVALLTGGDPELGADEISAALIERGAEVHRLDVDARGADLVEVLARLQPDVALLTLGPGPARWGCMQGLLEMLHIPYAGSGVLGCAVTADLPKARELLRLHGVPVPAYYVGRMQSAEAMQAQHGSFGYPAQLRARTPGDWQHELTQASDWQAVSQSTVAPELGPEFVAERIQSGHGCRVALLDGRVFGLSADVQVRAGWSEVRVQGLLTVARQAAAALCCSGPTLVHLNVGEAMNEWVTDVDVAPSLRCGAPFAQIAAQAGYDHASLCERVVAGARLHWAREPRLKGEVTRVRELVPSVAARVA